jgi:hypothetical protein
MGRLTTRFEPSVSPQFQRAAGACERLAPAARGCVTHWQPIGRASSRMGVNFRNFDPSVIESTRVRRLDGANTWKFLD